MIHIDQPPLKIIPSSSRRYAKWEETKRLFENVCQ
jgi:hypothetical protein